MVARESTESKQCLLCGQTSRRIPAAIGVCPACIRERSEEAREITDAAHANARAAFGLPPHPPRHPDGARCVLCSNECVIAEGETGFCGLRTVRNGRLVHEAGTPARGLFQWYRDPLPTNCVADWVCQGGDYRGRHNLAVFYQSCTADCLFCQNWHFRKTKPVGSRLVSAEELASVANKETFCVCYFGGDPSSQMPHALAVSKRLADMGVRVCWETNGMMHPKLLDRAVDHSTRTGGCVKFDLKAFDDTIHMALTGVSNRRTLANFTRAAERFNQRPEPPLVVASTLLVPGYVDADQVGKIARFIASINPNIPYSLLAFSPDFCLIDLPRTSARHAREAEAAARDAGLTRVRVGNTHLLEAEWGRF
ncbi:MAG: radical SAM protein [Candidatus Latescibacterota bacterium]|nr:MAG: radical SAM protein [Candidatus Latescibacterota bacterium]